MFTVPGPADDLLRERRCSEDDVLTVLGGLGGPPAEPAGSWEAALVRARETADGCGHAEAGSLHLLLGLSRLGRSAAAQVLERCAPPLSTLRTQVLAELTAGVRKRAPRDEGDHAPLAPRAPLRDAPRTTPPSMPPVRPANRPGLLMGTPAGTLNRERAAPVMPAAPHLSSPHLPQTSAAPLGVPQPLSHGPRVAVTELPAPRPEAEPRDERSSRDTPRPDLRERDLGLVPPSGLSGLFAREERPSGVQAAEPSRGPDPSQAPRTQAPPPHLARFALDPRNFPWLTTHGRNLSLAAALGELDPAIGRESEVEEVLDILGKRRANNPVLVGEPGVGKTAIVEGLAQRLTSLAQGSPGSPFDRIVVELDVGGLVAGTALRGSFSERLIGIKDEVKRADGRVIVFIDELHMLIGAGATGEGPQDAANELKAALARGDFPCVGATTHDEFRKHIQGDPALERRFVPVLVREPSPRQAHQILRGAAARYQNYHQVTFLDDALEAACSMTARYVRDRFLPDKAFAAIDLAGSRARREGRTEVTRDDVARAVSRMAGLPEERLLQPDGERFLTLERRLSERIVGHEQSLGQLTRVLRRNHAGFAGQRPLASLLFCGPSGVGKTETAKVLAEELFPSGTHNAAAALVRIDLSEFTEPHSASRLIGAGPGYVGYGEGGLLTEPVRRRPSCVILLDEAEKAHPSVLQLLLQVFDEGQLTDGRGRRVDLTAAVIVLTTNAGAAAFGGNGGRPAGFLADREPVPSSGPFFSDVEPTLPPTPAQHPQAQRALELAKASFAPELWSRLDERLVFAPLSREEVARVARLLLLESSRRLWEERRISFRTGPGLVEALVAAGGYQPALGARPMRQTIERLVESPLADEILAGRVRSGERLLACAGPGGSSAVEFKREHP
jgi:ATP-dependent Clp protease ATP-binding subunit ClpC